MGKGKTGRKHKWSCLVITRKKLFTRTTPRCDSSRSCLYIPYVGVTIFKFLAPSNRTLQENSYSSMDFYNLQKKNKKKPYTMEKEKRKHFLKRVFYKQPERKFEQSKVKDKVQLFHVKVSNLC